MLNFNALDPVRQQEIAGRLNACAEQLGGQHRLLSLVETVYKAGRHPLSAKSSSFHYPYGKVSWGKIIYEDKIRAFSQIVKNIDSAANLMENVSKKELNVIRALFPITFTITPKEEAEGCTLKAFDAPDQKTTYINPLFELLFFASPGLVKKILGAATEPEA